MQEMHDLLDRIRQYDHQQYDAFVCCILTHGQMGHVFGSDSVPIPIQELTGLFTGIKCRSLAGKPKLFFIQACQGKVRQEGVKRLVETDNPKDSSITTIPSENDFLIGMATVPGYASFRNRDDGSWYIMSLVEHIKQFHDRVDMANLLALVTGHMAKCVDENGFKQSPFYKSTLTMPLFL